MAPQSCSASGDALVGTCTLRGRHVLTWELGVSCPSLACRHDWLCGRDASVRAQRRGADWICWRSRVWALLRLGVRRCRRCVVAVVELAVGMLSVSRARGEFTDREVHEQDRLECCRPARGIPDVACAACSMVVWRKAWWLVPCGCSGQSQRFGRVKCSAWVTRACRICAVLWRCAVERSRCCA